MKIKLIPVITVNILNRKILFIAWMSKKTFKKTLNYGICIYFSRSRKMEWIKGSTSGNFQLVRKIFFDCDNDNILIFVKQFGYSCHYNIRTCFFKYL